MGEGMITLTFIRNVPDKGKYIGDTITMSPMEYKALLKVTHSKNRDKDGKPNPLDWRLNHTEITDGEELLEKKAPGPKEPGDMTINECKTELTHKKVEFKGDEKVADLQKLVADNRQ